MEIKRVLAPLFSIECRNTMHIITYRFNLTRDITSTHNYNIGEIMDIDTYLTIRNGG